MQQVDVGLHQTVEEHKTSRTVPGDCIREVPDRTEIRRQLDGDGKAGGTAYRLHDVDIMRLDIAAGFKQIGGRVIHIQFKRRRAGLFGKFRIFNPARSG